MRWRQAAVIAATATTLVPVAAQQPKPAGPPPAAIIEKHLVAVGGRDALRAVKTMVVRGRNAGLGVADRPLVRYLKHANLLRQQDAPGATTFIVSDGAKVYQVGGSGTVEVTQAWASPLRHTTIDDGFLDDGKLGIRYEYLGSEGIKTGPWKFHHLRRVFPDGYAEDLYFEADSGLLRIRVEDNGRAKRVFYDYRNVGGIRYPFVTATVIDGLEPPHLFIADEVTLNVALDDGFFLKIGGVALPAGLGASRGPGVPAESARHPVQAAPSAAAQARPQPAAVSSGGAEEAVRALYRHVTFARGRDVRWDDVRALFIPEAVIVLRSSRTSMTVYDPDGFVREFVKFVTDSKLEDRAFEESIIAIKTQEIGDVARAIVHYAARIPSEPRRPEQGIDVFLLMKKEGAWRIVSLVNELVRPGVPVPEELGAVPPAAARDIIAAVQAGRADTVRALLAADPGLVRATDTYGNNLLRLAVIGRDAAMADVLIRAGLDVNAERADLGGSLLITAASIGSLDLVKLLVERGADLHRTTPRGGTAVVAAVNARQKPIVDYLLARGARLDLDAAPALPLLRNALAGGMTEIAGRILQEKTIDYGAQDERGQTLLHAAARGPSASFARPLAEKGLSPDARDLFGWTPLHVAADAGQLAMVDALVELGATKNLRTGAGRTPYNLADAAGHKPVMVRLAALGCDTRAQVFPELRSTYVDATLPSGSLRVFAPDIVSDPNTLEHSPMAFSRDMQALAWSVGGRLEVSAVMVMERRDGRWTAPARILTGASHPSLSSDGRRLFFTAWRTLADGSPAGDEDIFYVERTTGGWGTPVSAGPGVNSADPDRAPTLSADDTLYFERQGRIYRARSTRGVYQEATVLPIEGPAIHPFAAQDESFVLFRRPGAASPAYVAFRRPDGSWSAAAEIPETIPTRGAIFPGVTPDGKYFFIAAGEVLWVDAGFLSELRARSRQ